MPVRRGTWLMAAAILAGVSAGCERPVVIANPQAALPPDEGSPAFLDRVSSQPTVRQNDAFRGILLLTGQDQARDFRQRVEALADRGLVDRQWTFDADRPLTRGRLAYMVCRACRIRGGVMMHLAGPTQRYCLRELQYLGMMAPGTLMAPVTGMEFIAVLARADAYLRTGKVPDIMKIEE